MPDFKKMPSVEKMNTIDQKRPLWYKMDTQDEILLQEYNMPVNDKDMTDNEQMTDQ